MSYNTTAVSYINKKGHLKSHECNKIAKDFGVWCTIRDLHISATHIPGKDNFEADKNSRKFQDAIEWQLNPKIFKVVLTPLVHQKLTYLPVRSTDKLKNMSPGNQRQKLLQLMLFL